MPVTISGEDREYLLKKIEENVKKFRHHSASFDKTIKEIKAGLR